ncbi:MAG: PQQ-binding-like beta-propeller repeat protein [Chloroflexi bacterium]|nr:PQQ-binding-like beta-propeller repeat protein [Chloroflexota bacterium]
MIKKSTTALLLSLVMLLVSACEGLQPIQTETPVPSSTATRPPTSTPQPTSTVEVEVKSEMIHLGMIWPQEGANIVGGIADSKGVIYLVDTTGTLHAVDVNGTELWNYKGDYEFASTPFLSPDEKTIYLVDDQDQVLAVDTSGKQTMRFKADSRIVSFPTVGPDGSIYLETIDRESKTFDNKIYRLAPDGTVENFSISLIDRWEDHAFLSNGGIVRWGWWNNEVIAVQTSTGEEVLQCKTKKPVTQLVVGPDDLLIYAVDEKSIKAIKSDCTDVWSFKWKDLDADKRIQYNLLYDGGDFLYVAHDNGLFQAVAIEDGKLLWQSESNPEVGRVVSIVTQEDGTIYAISSRAQFMAFDQNGKLLWEQEVYKPGIPGLLQKLPNNELLLIQGGQAMIYSYDQALTYTPPEGAGLPADEDAAREEIISFVLDFIVTNEIGGTANYIESSGMPWVDAAPQANIIVYSPPKENSNDSWSYIDSDHPISVWWYADNQLTKVEDMQKAIDEYEQIYMNDPQSDIFAWGSYDFGILEIGKDLRSAKIYVGASCGPLCGHGLFYYLQRSASGEWWIYDAVDLWVS